MTLVNTETGEIVAVHPEEPGAIAMLNQAIGALTTALDQMPIGEVVNLKAKVATVQTATRELGMSKEAQELAAEAVRRAEWTLRRATVRAQETGEMSTRESNLRNNARNDGTSTSTLPKPRDLFASESEYRDALAMGDLDENQFDEVIAEAKDEGNLSRANVAKKAREKKGCGLPAPAKPRRAPLTESFFRTVHEARRKVESLHRLVEDDRWTQNAEKVAAIHRNDLLGINDLLQQVINSLPTEESTE